MRPGKYTTTATAIPRIFLAGVATFFFLLGSEAPLQAQEFQAPDLQTAPAAIGPPDVYMKVKSIQQALESLRLYMGARKAKPLNLLFSEATPHDVYFMSLAMLDKLNRLSFEIIRTREPSLPVTRNELSQPGDVLLQVEKGHAALHRIMEYQDIAHFHQDLVRDPSVTPTEVLTEIMAANRQLNLLLERRLTSSGVYSLVIQAVDYAAHLLVQYPDAVPLPEQPEFEAGKTPADVLDRLIECLETVSTIYNESALEPCVCVAKTELFDPDEITNSDTYDIVTLLLARLDYLRIINGNTGPVHAAFYPGHKYPSDVYQLTGILLNQTQQLAYQAKNHKQGKNIGGK